MGLTRATTSMGQRRTAKLSQTQLLHGGCFEAVQQVCLCWPAATVLALSFDINLSPVRTASIEARAAWLHSASCCIMLQPGTGTGRCVATAPTMCVLGSRRAHDLWLT